MKSNKRPLEEGQLVKHRQNDYVGQVLQVFDVKMGQGRIVSKVKVLWLRPTAMLGRTNIVVNQILEPVTET